MLLRFPDVLSSDELDRLRAIAKATTFVDGRESASARLADTKLNEQMPRTDPAIGEVARIVGAALDRTPAFRAATIPNRMHSLRLARYGAGMRYGAHVDAAIMHDGGVTSRADLSFTVFLSDPESYDGGELELESGSEISRTKLPARHAVVYPTGRLHAVTEVTRGERLVVVGWVQSFVPAAADREVLWNLGQAMELVHANEGKSRAYDLLLRTHADLLRRWASP